MSSGVSSWQVRAGTRATVVDIAVAAVAIILMILPSTGVFAGSTALRDTGLVTRSVAPQRILAVTFVTPDTRLTAIATRATPYTNQDRQSGG